MGQQFRLKDGTIVEAQPDGTYHEVFSSAPSAMQIKPADPKLPYEVTKAQGQAAAAPYEAPKAVADIASTRAQAGHAAAETDIARAQAPYAGQKAQADAIAAQAAAKSAQYKASQDDLATAKQELEQWGGAEQVDQLIRAVERAKGLVGSSTTGWGGALLHNLPATDARTLDNVIKQEVRGNVFMQRIQQLKDTNPSPNGGTGIGRIMQAEIPMITGAGGALDIGMKGSDLLQSLDQIEHGALRAKAKLSGQNPDNPHVLTALMPANHAGATPPAIGAPPPPGGPGAPPSGPGGGPNVPHADYSGMVGGPGASLATMDQNSKLGAFKQTYRNVYDPTMASTLSAFIKKGQDYDTVANFAQSHGFNPPDPKSYADAVAFARGHHGATNVEANRLVPTTLGERLASSPAASAAAGAASGASAGLDDVVGRTIAGPGWDANQAALQATHPVANALGNTVGGIGAMALGGGALADTLAAGAQGGVGRNAVAWALKNPIKAATTADAGYGTVYGASENPSNPVAGAGVGGLTGMFASPIGAYGTKALGAAVRGVADPAVQRLRDAGIPLTVGEVLGGGAKKAQDAMTSVFGPGSMVTSRYGDGRQALNQVAFQRAGQTVGANIHNVGQPGLLALRDAKNNAYSQALDPVNINLNNPQAIGDLSGAINAAKAIPNVDQASDYASGALSNFIGNAAPQGNMSGTDFQQAYRGLSRTARQASGRAYGHEIGQALGQGQDALVGALQQQNPGAYQGFLNANSANRHLSILADAVSTAKNQIGDDGQPLFTGAQLNTANMNNARTYNGRVAAASGSGPFNQLAMDAQKAMSNKVGESGTFPRQLMGAMILGGGGGMFGGSAGAAADGEDGAEKWGGLGATVPLGLLTLLGTRRGQKLLTGALANRTAADRYTGNLLLKNPTVGSDALTASLLPLLPKP
jgi:hypothetical protein